jgi:hypothetical protein
MAGGYLSTEYIGPLAQELLTPGQQTALQLAAIGAGAYQAYDGFRNGQNATAAFGVVLLAMGISQLLNPDYGSVGAQPAKPGGAQGGISNETRSGWATSGLEPAQAREGAVPLSARRVGANNVEITYSDGTVEVRSGGSVSWRNNNPGNLDAGDFSNRHGAIGAGANGRAVFPDAASGRAAQVDLLSSPNYRNLTLDAAIARWTRTDVLSYQAFVRGATGLPGSTVLNTLTDTQLNAVASAMTRFEGWTPGRAAYGVPQ